MRANIALAFLATASAQFAVAFIVPDGAPPRKLHPDRSRVRRSAESVSFQEREDMIEYCILHGFDADSCVAAAESFEVDADATFKAMQDAEFSRVGTQLTTLSADPLAAPVHLEYLALLALLVVLSVDVLDVSRVVGAPLA